MGWVVGINIPKDAANIGVRIHSHDWQIEYQRGRVDAGTVTATGFNFYVDDPAAQAEFAANGLIFTYENSANTSWFNSGDHWTDGSGEHVLESPVH